MPHAHVTGFFFHSEHFGPPHVIGVISLVVLALVILARYVYRLAGAWRRIYVGGAVLALYLNVFVGVVQAFQKLPFLSWRQRSPSRHSLSRSSSYWRSSWSSGYAPR